MLYGETRLMLCRNLVRLQIGTHVQQCFVRKKKETGQTSRKPYGGT